MAVEKDHHHQWRARLDEKGEPFLLPAKELMPQYLAKVGANFNQEIFHPDEILAQSFVLVANQPKMELLNQIQGALKV